MRHPDFSKSKVDPEVKRNARIRVAKRLYHLLEPGIPIRTGQLRASYRQNTGLGRFGPLNTKRNDSPLTNKELANILVSRGYLNIVLSGNLEREAVRIVRDEVNKNRSKIIRFKGIKVLY